MKEDLSPYMIPNPWGLCGMKSSDYSNTSKSLELPLKNAKSSDSTAFSELQTLVASATSAYIGNFKVDTRIPYRVRQSFERDMELFPQHFSEQVTTTFDSALGKGLVTNRELAAAYDEVESGLRTLSAKLNRYDQEFSTWLTLESFQKDGYTRFLFISEQSSTTCDQCLVYHGQVFSISDAPLPPLHPNCRCELLLMDERAETLYHKNERAFIESFRQARSGVKGGIYLLNYSAYPFRITSDNLTKVPVCSAHTITDCSHSAREDDEYSLADAAASYFSELFADAKDLATYLVNASRERRAKRWDSLGSFLDWLTFGIVTGTWRGISSNWNTMIHDPSLYNIVNFITLGTLDTISGALNPDDPWSLEHWLDILGTILTVYSVYKSALSVKKILTDSGDDALRVGGNLVDDVDDVARSAGLTQAQIDDIISIPKGARPDPSTYLSQEYIDEHLAMFQDGVTKIYPSAPSGAVGPPDGTFVLPASYADDIITQANGDIRILEQLLGFDPGYLGDNPVRIDIARPQGLRIPSGNEFGTNEFWLPGGYTSGGIPEAIIDQIQPGTYASIPIK